MSIDPTRTNMDAGKVAPLPRVKKVTAKEIQKAQQQETPKEQVSISRSLFKSVGKPEVAKSEAKKPDSVQSKSLRNDQYELQDGYDPSRDLVAVYAKEGKSEEPYKFSLEVSNLREGAELGNLDVYTLISVGKGVGETKLPDDIPGVTSEPWNVALGKYDSKNFKAVDDKGNIRPDALSNVRFDSNSNRIDFSLNKTVLREQGWKDGQPIKLQAFTAKDFRKQVIDSFDEPAKKPWANDGKLSRYVDTANPESLHPKRDENWADDVIYFVMTDRFHDGDPNNNHEVNKGDLRRFHGGDLKGLTEKLDYIKDLGATTVWITPAMDNQNEFIDMAGYHGYWPVDFFKVEEHQGTMQDFEKLIDEAHKKDMKIMLDVPLNHTAWEHPFRKDPEKKDWFHQIGDIVDWDDPHQIENGSMYGLPDLAQENPKVYDYLMDMSKFWIDKGVDGFRLDAVMHIPRDFWQKYTSDIKEYAGPDFMMIGEVFHGDPDKIQPYQQEGMPSLFDMPLFFSIRETFAWDGSMKKLAGRMQELEGKYQDPSMMAAIMDNHDTDRFITMAGQNGKEKAKLALAFLMSINRIPTIYYGTEQAMEGFNEHMGQHPPENRKDMQFGHDKDMENYSKKLIHARTDSPALRDGALLEMWKDDEVYAFSRMHPDQEAVGVFNNSYGNQFRSIPLRKESQLKEGQVMKDIISGWEVPIQDGKIKVNLGRKQPAIFLPKDSIK